MAGRNIKCKSAVPAPVLTLSSLSFILPTHGLFDNKSEVTPRSARSAALNYLATENSDVHNCSLLLSVISKNHNNNDNENG